MAVSTCYHMPPHLIHVFCARCRYHDLGTLLSFDKSELLEILSDDLSLTAEEVRRFIDGVNDAPCID